MRCGAPCHRSLASERSVPRLVILEPPKLTIPRKLKMLSLKIVLGITRTEEVIMVPKELGKICFQINRLSRAPNVPAAMTYS